MVENEGRAVDHVKGQTRPFWDNTYRLTNEVTGRGYMDVQTEQHVWRVTFVANQGKADGEFRLTRRKKRAQE